MVVGRELAQSVPLLKPRHMNFVPAVRLIGRFSRTSLDTASATVDTILCTFTRADEAADAVASTWEAPDATRSLVRGRDLDNLP